jgi:hypothetical protein
MDCQILSDLREKFWIFLIKNHPLPPPQEENYGRTTPPLRGTSPQEENNILRSKIPTNSPPVEGGNFAQQNDGVVLIKGLMTEETH